MKTNIHFNDAVGDKKKIETSNNKRRAKKNVMQSSSRRDMKIEKKSNEIEFEERKMNEKNQKKERKREKK